MIVPTTSGTTPNCPSRKSGVHVVPGQELPRADLAEELDRRQQEREDDAERREYGDGCGDEQDQVDELLTPADPLPRQCHRRLADDGVVRRHGSTYPVASAIFDCSSASCSSLSGTNWAASAIDALLSSMNSTKLRTSSFSSNDACFT